MPARADCALRLAAMEDAERLRSWRNQDRIRANMYSDHLIEADEHAAWLSRTLASDTARVMVFELAGQPVGMVGFSNIDRHNDRCDWAFYLGEETPRGTGAAMEFLALDHAFDDLGIGKLCCEVFAFNAGVVKMHGRFGFQQEALFVRHRRKGDRLEDVVALALFADDWRSRRATMAETVFR
jgi:UDP-4-amino-4,6-dideoxy-N-acetyl-beta-L-altrosamine N-acetyltransferase